MGGLAKAAFPIIGGLAFIGMLTEAGSKVYEFFQKLSEAPEKARAAFEGLLQPMQLSASEAQVALDKINILNDKLEGRAYVKNNLKLLIDEAIASAQKLGEEIDKDLKKLGDVLKETNSSWAVAHFAGGVDIGDEAKINKHYEDEIKDINRKANAAIISAKQTMSAEDALAKAKEINAQRDKRVLDKEWDARMEINRLLEKENGLIAANKPVALGLKRSDFTGAAPGNQERAESLQSGVDALDAIISKTAITLETRTAEGKNKDLEAKKEAKKEADRIAKEAARAAAAATKEAEDERQQVSRMVLAAERRNREDLDKTHHLQEEMNGGLSLYANKLRELGSFDAQKINMAPQARDAILGAAFARSAEDLADKFAVSAEHIAGEVAKMDESRGIPTSVGGLPLANLSNANAPPSDASIGPGKKAIELAQHVMGTHGADLAIMKQAEEILQKQLITGKDIEGNVVSQQETSLALYNLDKERLQLQIQMAEEQDTLKGSLTAFFDEMNLQSRNSGKILTAELSKAVDDSSKILADMATGEYKKGDLSKSVRSISHDMLQSSIKNAMQRGLGTMGGKLDGSTPATAPWVRVANALQAAGAQIGPSGMGWGVGGAGASNEGSGGFSPFGGGLELGGAPGAPDASSQSRVRRLLSSFLNQGSAAQSPLGKFLPGFLGGAPKVSESLPAGMGDAAGATADMSSTISDMMAAAPALAGGGDVNPSAAYTWVGEQGPELLARGSSGHVFSNSDSTKILAGSGGDTFHIDARGSDPALVESKVRRSVAAAHQSAVSVAHTTARQQARRTPQ
jgi:hypothetical protein